MSRQTLISKYNQPSKMKESAELATLVLVSCEVKNDSFGPVVANEAFEQFE